MDFGLFPTKSVKFGLLTNRFEGILSYLMNYNFKKVTNFKKRTFFIKKKDHIFMADLQGLIRDDHILSISYPTILYSFNYNIISIIFNTYHFLLPLS